MIGGNVYSYSDDAVTHSGKPPVPLSDPEQYGLSSLYRLYEAADGWIFLAAVTERERADASAQRRQLHGWTIRVVRRRVVERVVEPGREQIAWDCTPSGAAA